MTAAARMETIEVVVPRNVSFSALKLRVHPNGWVTLDSQVLGDVAAASGLTMADLVENSDPMLLPALLGAWLSHALEGGEAVEDAAIQRAIIDSMAESAWGTMKREPGRLQVDLVLLTQTRLH